MIDLSNNNATGHDFRKIVRFGHQRRVYLKRTEDAGYVDPTFSKLRTAAHRAEMRVGGYHFAHPLQVTPRESFSFYTKHEPRYVRGHDLRDALDLEYGKPSPKVGAWAEEWIKLHRAEFGFYPVLYVGAYYAEPCNFAAWMGRVPLWLPAYGRNDGKEYPAVVPKPWRGEAAHQYSSQALVPGVHGRVDLSHVIHGGAIDVPGPIRKLTHRGG